MEERLLPIGIQDFEKLRKDRYVYVDKTEFVYNLAHTKCPYFLSRPRRFGKSLLISTLEAYFLNSQLNSEFRLNKSRIIILRNISLRLFSFMGKSNLVTPSI